MKVRKNPLVFLLLICLLLLISGLYMTIDSYYKRLSIESAYNQAEFFRTMPYLIKKGETLEMPVYLENKPMENNPFITGTAVCRDFKEKLSIKELNIEIHRAPFSSVQITTLLDTRVRN